MELDQKKILDLIKDIHITMMTTVHQDGSMHSRPMATQKTFAEKFDGILWFFTKIDSGKVYQIEQDQHINLAYSHPDKQKYVSISGKAIISQDKTKMKELWNPLLKAWFPEGLDDPQISLIGVKIDDAELWDAPPSKVVQMVGMLKAAVTGKPYDHQAHNEHIELNRH